MHPCTLTACTYSPVYRWVHYVESASKVAVTPHCACQHVCHCIHVPAGGQWRKDLLHLPQPSASSNPGGGPLLPCNWRQGHRLSDQQECKGGRAHLGSLCSWHHCPKVSEPGMKNIVMHGSRVNESHPTDRQTQQELVSNNGVCRVNCIIISLFGECQLLSNACVYMYICACCPILTPCMCVYVCVCVCVCTTRPEMYGEDVTTAQAAPHSKYGGTFCYS